MRFLTRQSAGGRYWPVGSFVDLFICSITFVLFYNLAMASRNPELKIMKTSVTAGIGKAVD